MQAMTISEATPQGMPIQAVTSETTLLSLVVRVDPPAPPREFLELLKRRSIVEEVLFAPNIDARLKITKPFLVTVKRREGIMTAYIEEINEFGYGSNSAEALYDLGRTLSELYFSLKDAADRLSPDLTSVWLKLAEHIQPRSA
ncbi:MAG: hypothetical protein AAB225_00900 [Acidobacteriota bacterium]